MISMIISHTSKGSSGALRLAGAVGEGLLDMSMSILKRMMRGGGAVDCTPLRSQECDEEPERVNVDG